MSREKIGKNALARGCNRGKTRFLIFNHGALWEKFFLQNFLSAVGKQRSELHTINFLIQ